MKRIKIIFPIGLIALAVVLFWATNYFNWKKAAEAAGAMPYQIGLSSVAVIPCVTTGTPPVCVGGTLCSIKDAATCALYSDVSGTPSGGMGSNAIFSKVALQQAGVYPGGQLIAGGMSPALMDSGVLAGPMGCYNCVSRIKSIDKIKSRLHDFYLAIVKD